MEQSKRNKEFITRYFNALSGRKVTQELLEEYISDKELIAHINFFTGAFPCYEIIVEEITAEDNRVVIHGRFKGCHKGDFNGISPTNRTVEVSVAVGYEIENEKIVHHWILADQMSLMEQLGVVPAAEPAH